MEFARVSFGNLMQAVIKEYGKSFMAICRQRIQWAKLHKLRMDELSQHKQLTDAEILSRLQAIQLTIHNDH